MQTYSKLQEHASDETPAGTGAQSAQTVVAGDPISAIVAEQEAIDAERAAKEKARLEALERSREAAVIPDGWTVQIGAFGVRENATAAAAHAEMMLSQQQQTGAGTVRVIDTGSMFRVVVGSVPSQQEAIALAKNVSSALGSSAYAIAEPAAQATAKP
ncbi:MAG: SPOR domain-containing protein [Duodenibacillus sp.]|nr:SPOR domain-containing protein [Duodenibacillus sp.]